MRPLQCGPGALLPVSPAQQTERARVLARGGEAKGCGGNAAPHAVPESQGLGQAAEGRGETK